MPSPTLLRCFSILHNVPVGSRLALPSLSHSEGGGGEGKRGCMPRLHHCPERRLRIYRCLWQSGICQSRHLARSHMLCLCPGMWPFTPWITDVNSGAGVAQPGGKAHCRICYCAYPGMLEPPSAAEPFGPQKPLSFPVCLCRHMVSTADQSGLSDTSRRARVLKIMPAAICNGIWTNKDFVWPLTAAAGYE